MLRASANTLGRHRRILILLAATLWMLVMATDVLAILGQVRGLAQRLGEIALCVCLLLLAWTPKADGEPRGSTASGGC